MATKTEMWKNKSKAAAKRRDDEEEEMTKRWMKQCTSNTSQLSSQEAQMKSQSRPLLIFGRLE